MSVRTYRIFSTESGSLIIQSVERKTSLKLQSGAILEICENPKEDEDGIRKITDAYGILGILHLPQGESDHLIVISGIFSVGQLYNSDVYRITNTMFIPLKFIDGRGRDLDMRLNDLKNLLSSGSFYFTNSNDGLFPYDITLSLQTLLQKKFHQKFHWNWMLSLPFQKHGIDSDNWLVKCICGSVLIRTIYVGSRIAKLALISRLSSAYVGTRFNVRGVNDDGDVANFVETEQLVTFEQHSVSFVQVRGSVPLFWEQPGINVGSHVISMGPLELSIPALRRHYNMLQYSYGFVYTVNLLGSKKGEQILSSAFKAAFSLMNSVKPMISFDYHRETKQSAKSLQHFSSQLSPLISDCNFFHRNNGSFQSDQIGVIRTNCMDCLDRTNAIQTLIGLKVIGKQMEVVGVEQIKPGISSRCEEILRDLWQKNGDQCSVIYAGTGALGGSSKLKDASRSIVRTIQNNLMDTSKQEAFDLLLCGATIGDRVYDKAALLLPPSLLRSGFYFYECREGLEAFVEKSREICLIQPITVFTGTWNVNGGKNVNNIAFRETTCTGKEQAGLKSWIFPTKHLPIDCLDYDLLAIGFQEIVDLNAGNLVKASTRNQRLWRDALKEVLNDSSAQTSNMNSSISVELSHKYTVLVCEQLVGVCFVIFAKNTIIKRIRGLTFDELKTGLGGAAGNKGAIAVRLAVDATSFCFVCSHFAAGQNEVAARNADFATTLRKICFTQGRAIQTHDVVFWIGDFNYRIGLGGDEVKRYIQANELDKLAEFDQLTQERGKGNVFNGFNEGPLLFSPTYKYDTFSDDYDTSEKCRSPAWTDRILWSSDFTTVELVQYNRVELKTSDHRPVFALFRVHILRPDLLKAQQVLTDLLCSMGPPDSLIICSVVDNEQNAISPDDFCAEVITKLGELGITIHGCHFDMEKNLQIMLGSGTEALIALSMDGINLSKSDGKSLKLCVRLRQNGKTEWPDGYIQRLGKLFEQEMMKMDKIDDNREKINAEDLIRLNLDEDIDDDSEDIGR